MSSWSDPQSAPSLVFAKCMELLKNNRMISVHFQANHSISQNNKIDYILCSQRWRSSILSAKTRPGADCGSDHELLIAKSKVKLTKVVKTTRPFRYDLNQIPYDHTVEVTNRFKGLDLIECLKIYGRRFITLCRRQRS